MHSTEFTYRLNLLTRIAHKIIDRFIEILFLLTSFATLGLMAYEFGYTITDSGKAYIIWGYKIIPQIFLYGSLIKIALNYKLIGKEKGFWIEIIILLLLLFTLITQKTEYLLSVTRFSPH